MYYYYYYFGQRIHLFSVQKLRTSWLQRTCSDYSFMCFSKRVQLSDYSLPGVLSISFCSALLLEELKEISSRRRRRKDNSRALASFLTSDNIARMSSVFHSLGQSWTGRKQFLLVVTSLTRQSISREGRRPL